MIWEEKVEDFPGRPVAKNPCFHCRGHGFNPGSGKIPHAMWYSQKKKKSREKNDEANIEASG